jgi:GNAT superfamily N-acetyltransferase
MPGPIRVANRADVGPLAASLSRAFLDDPVMEYLIPHERTRRGRLEGFFQVWLTIKHLPLGATYTDTDRTGGALWSPPGRWKWSVGQILRGSPKFLGAYGRHVPRALRVLSVIEGQHPHTPHWYLGVLGTDPIHQGKGIGSALLAPVLDRCDRDGLGAYLESSKESNIAFYGRHRFEVTGEIVLPGGPTVWPMWRDPRPPDEA